MSGWSYCPYEINFHCRRLKRECSPGVPGCILFGLVERKDGKHIPQRWRSEGEGKKGPSSES